MGRRHKNNQKSRDANPLPNVASIPVRNLGDEGIQKNVMRGLPFWFASIVLCLLVVLFTISACAWTFVIFAPDWGLDYAQELPPFLSAISTVTPIVAPIIVIVLLKPLRIPAVKFLLGLRQPKRLVVSLLVFTSAIALLAWHCFAVLLKPGPIEPLAKSITYLQDLRITNLLADASYKIGVSINSIDNSNLFEAYLFSAKSRISDYGIHVSEEQTLESSTHYGRPVYARVLGNLGQANCLVQRGQFDQVVKKAKRASQLARWLGSN